MNTFYSAFDVLKSYIKKQGLTIVNYSVKQRYNYCIMWVAPNDSDITHFVCRKVGPLQFMLNWYGEDYAEIGNTSFEFSDVNTPTLCDMDS